MELVLITPTNTHTYSVSWIEAHTDAGSYVIQPNHAPMIVPLAVNKELIFCLSNGKRESILIIRGIMEITRKKATVIHTIPFDQQKQ